MQFKTALLSKKGGRKVNQDYASFIKSGDGGCWALADGLGGYQAGEIAAKLAVDTILQEYQQQQNNSLHWLNAAIDKVQTALHEQQNNAPVYRSMRTTIVVLTCQKDRAYWAHVGDSRVYHFRHEQIISQTKDHSVCQALVTAGEMMTDQIRFHEDRNRLYRVLGSDGAVKATFLKDEVPIKCGDAFLLCSDGFWEYVVEAEMERTRIRAATPFEWLEMMETTLKERVTDIHDNYSALAVYVSE